MNIKAYLNDVYGKIAKPLDRCTEDLNSVSGILKYMDILEKVKLNFEKVMKNKEEELVQKYPCKKDEIKKYIASLKDNLNFGKSTVCLTLYSFLDYFRFALSAA